MLRFRKSAEVTEPRVQGSLGYSQPEDLTVTRTVASTPEKRTRFRGVNPAQKKLVGFVFGFPVAALLLCQATFNLYAEVMGTNESASLTEIRKMGVFTEVSDFQSLQVPDSDNAAPLYRKVTAGLSDPVHKEAVGAIERLSSSQPSLIDDLKARALYPTLSDELALLERAADRPSCNWNRDWSKGFSMMFPEYAEMKRFVRLLAYKAQLQTEAGDASGALKTLARAKRVADHSGSEPVLIAMLVRVANESIVLASVQRLAQNPAFGPAELRRADAFVYDFGDLPNLKWTLGGEIIFARSGIDSLRSLGDLAKAVGSSQTPTPLDLLPMTSSVRHAMVATYLRHIRGLVDQMPEDQNDWRGITQAASQNDIEVMKDNSFFGRFTQLLYPTYVNSSQSLGRLVGSRRLTQSVLSVLMQRANGQRPHLPSGERSIDPFTDKPFRFRQDENGITIWGVGADEIDNGGTRNGSLADGLDQVATIAPAP